MARLRVEIVGTEAVLRRMAAAGRDLTEKLRVGIGRAALELQRQSQLVVPVSGWDPVISPPRQGSGTLKNSAFTRDKTVSRFRPEYHVGYTAAYAIYVHELIDNRHHSTKMAKFLETPARTNRRLLRDIIARVMQS